MSKGSAKNALSLTAENSFGQPPPSSGGTPSKGHSRTGWAASAAVDRSRSPTLVHAESKENAMIQAYKPDKVGGTAPKQVLSSAVTMLCECI